MAEVRVRLPLTYEVIERLRAGDYVYLTGPVLACRDAAHKRMVEALKRGERLPVDIRGQVIYYVGPTPPRPGTVIGSAGPTTSMRMDPFTIPLLEAGLKGSIGKGGRGPEVREALVKHRAAYFLAVGGAGALLSKQIRRVEVVAYEELGTEAVRLMEVEEFPVVVCNDICGGDLLEQGKAAWRRAEVLGG
ncbi:MAG TPA: FumA C-terminus/TtdB family hydratase beta subunit [Dehalococcoidia bacterium]|nr:FumA C-terminus/TtdB family hydratase beta subunit [Dehalococcoidia bacterium]